MLSAIYLHDELELQADKINNVRTNRLLPSELRAH